MALTYKIRLIQRGVLPAKKDVIFSSFSSRNSTIKIKRNRQVQKKKNARQTDQLYRYLFVAHLAEL